MHTHDFILQSISSAKLRHRKSTTFRQVFPGSFHPSSGSLSARSCLFPSFFFFSRRESWNEAIGTCIYHIACAEWGSASHDITTLLSCNMCAFFRQTKIEFHHNTSTSSNTLRCLGETDNPDVIIYVSYMSPYMCGCSVILQSYWSSPVIYISIFHTFVKGGVHTWCVDPQIVDTSTQRI